VDKCLEPSIQTLELEYRVIFVTFFVERNYLSLEMTSAWGAPAGAWANAVEEEEERHGSCYIDFWFI